MQSKDSAGQAERAALEQAAQRRAFVCGGDDRNNYRIAALRTGVEMWPATVNELGDLSPDEQDEFRHSPDAGYWMFWVPSRDGNLYDVEYCEAVWVRFEAELAAARTKQGLLERIPVGGEVLRIWAIEAATNAANLIRAVVVYGVGGWNDHQEP